MSRVESFRARARWLARRAARRLKRPLPLVLRVGNLMGASAGPAKGAQILRNLIADHVDVLILVECGDVTVRDLVDLDVWRVAQWGRNNPDEGAKISLSGCALLVRRRRIHLRQDTVRLVLGSPATSEGKRKTGSGIRARWVMLAQAIIDAGTASVWRTSFAVGHPPPARAPRARARFMSVFTAAAAAVKGGDFNLTARIVARLTGRKVRFVGVLGVAVAWWIPVSEAIALDVDGDHLALEVTLWPARKSRNRKARS